MSNTKKAKLSIDEIIGAARLPESTVRLCLNPDLNSEHQRIEADLLALGEFVPTSMADTDPRLPLAQALRGIESRMAEAQVTFVFRALGRRKYRELQDAHPGKAADERFDIDTFSRALIAACAVDPEMSEVDVDRLADILSNAEYESLFMACYTVNEGATSVPFSRAASEVLSRPGAR